MDIRSQEEINIDTTYGDGMYDRLQETGRMPWLPDEHYEILDEQ